MQRILVVTLASVLGLGPLVATDAVGQETPRPDVPKTLDRPGEPKPKARPTSLRVQLVIARYQGEKKVGSVPYSFLVTAGTPAGIQPLLTGMIAKLRMGVEIPVPTTVSDRSGQAIPSSYVYRNVGTNIDCTAEDVGDGLFALRLNVENSSLYSSPEGRSPSSASEMPLGLDIPLFRAFNVSLNPVLRDGQNVQAVASTDLVTGEVVKIDVSLSVVK